MNPLTHSVITHCSLHVTSKQSILVFDTSLIKRAFHSSRYRLCRSRDDVEDRLKTQKRLGNAPVDHSRCDRARICIHLSNRQAYKKYLRYRYLTDLYTKEGNKNISSAVWFQFTYNIHFRVQSGRNMYRAVARLKQRLTHIVSSWTIGPLK